MKILFKFDFCVWDGGPPFPLTIPGSDIPLGLFLKEVPDLVGAMAACPSLSSVCHEKLTFQILETHTSLSTATK